ncbi:MAG TPA: hypothetical protein VEA99_10165 [Gemmatimonadaceae bacterium]|nr:hypothetical protein [Gemmatimonadaceae bacterium]
MSNLGDYLGLLLSEIAMARMQADLETVRIAELYASHPLLRRMPVPHIRLPDVDLDIPLLIKEAQPPREGESPRGGVPAATLRKRFEQVLQAELVRSGVKLSPTALRKLQAALDARERSGMEPPELAVGVHRAADDFTTTALDVIKKVTVTPRGEATPATAIDESVLRDDVRTAFLQLRPQPPRLDVIVTSAEIREGATADNLARIRLKVTEQGVEWASIQSNGSQRDILVPE